MSKRPLFLAAFIFFGIALSFPSLLIHFNKPELLLGFPFFLVYIAIITFMILITWIVFYYAFYRK